MNAFEPVIVLQKCFYTLKDHVYVKQILRFDIVYLGKVNLIHTGHY